MTIEVSSLVVALASLLATIFVGWISVHFARRAQLEAKDAVERSHSDWRQQKWFDLYFEAHLAYDLLDRFQAVANSLGGAQLGDLQAALDDVTRQFRKVHTLALVFPKCKEIDQLIEATSGLSSEAAARKKDRLPGTLEASEGIRQLALLDADVLSKRA